jgi:spermidine/putrescine transport system ATP-binding protein
MLSGVVSFILYKGNHYHLTISTANNESIFADTHDVWDDGDRVGINISAKSIKVEAI